MIDVQTRDHRVQASKIASAIAIGTATVWLGAIAINPASAETTGTPAATDDTKALALTVAKFNAYVSYMNYTEGAVTALQRYGSWVNTKTGPTGRERNIEGIGSASNGGDSRTVALKSIDTAPALPELDDAIKAYAVADDAAVTVINEAHGYYAREDWKLDHMEGGRELNSRIVEVSAPYFAARRHLEEVMGVEKRLLDQISLDTIDSKEGHSSRWNILNVTMHSKVVVERLSDTRLPRVDMKTFDEDLALMGKAVKDFDDFSAQHPDASLSTGMSDDLLAEVRHIGERLDKAKGDLHRLAPSALQMMRIHFDAMLATIQPPPKIGR